MVVLRKLILNIILHVVAHIRYGVMKYIIGCSQAVRQRTLTPSGRKPSWVQIPPSKPRIGWYIMMCRPKIIYKRDGIR